MLALFNENYSTAWMAEWWISAMWQSVLSAVNSWWRRKKSAVSSRSLWWCYQQKEFLNQKIWIKKQKSISIYNNLTKNIHLRRDSNPEPLNAIRWSAVEVQRAIIHCATETCSWTFFVTSWLMRNTLKFNWSSDQLCALFMEWPT